MWKQEYLTLVERCFEYWEDLSTDLNYPHCVHINILRTQVNNINLQIFTQKHLAFLVKKGTRWFFFVKFCDQKGSFRCVLRIQTKNCFDSIITCKCKHPYSLCCASLIVSYKVNVHATVRFYSHRAPLVLLLAAMLAKEYIDFYFNIHIKWCRHRFCARFQGESSKGLAWCELGLGICCVVDQEVRNGQNDPARGKLTDLPRKISGLAPCRPPIFVRFLRFFRSLLHLITLSLLYVMRKHTIDGARDTRDAPPVIFCKKKESKMVGWSPLRCPPLGNLDPPLHILSICLHSFVWCWQICEIGINMSFWILLRNFLVSEAEKFNFIGCPKMLTLGKQGAYG